MLNSTFFFFVFFFFNDMSTTVIYTLSLHDALPISREISMKDVFRSGDSSKKFKIAEGQWYRYAPSTNHQNGKHRSEERFSRNAETDIVCRLLLEKITRMRYLGGGLGCMPRARRTTR